MVLLICSDELRDLDEKLKCPILFEQQIAFILFLFFLKSQPRIIKSWLCCWDKPLGSINFTLITFNNIKVLASYVQTTVWAISVTNCGNATFWPICIMQEMWPIGSGQCMGNPSGNSQEVLGILHWIPVSLQRGLFNHPSSYITLHSV